MKKSSKLLVEAGVIPKEALQQMETWGTVPEGASKLHGAKRVTLEDEKKAKRFVQNLKNDVETDMQEIRETEFSQLRPINVVVGVNGNTTKVMANVDQLGRIHLPYRRHFEEASTILVGDGPARKVVKVEPRYQSDNPVAWVCYLE